MSKIFPDGHLVVNVFFLMFSAGLYIFDVIIVLYSKYNTITEGSRRKPCLRSCCIVVLSGLCQALAVKNFQQYCNTYISNKRRTNKNLYKYNFSRLLVLAWPFFPAFMKTTNQQYYTTYTPKYNVYTRLNSYVYVYIYILATYTRLKFRSKREYKLFLMEKQRFWFSFFTSRSR